MSEEKITVLKSLLIHLINHEIEINGDIFYDREGNKVTIEELSEALQSIQPSRLISTT